MNISTTILFTITCEDDLNIDAIHRATGETSRFLMSFSGNVVMSVGLFSASIFSPIK